MFLVLIIKYKLLDATYYQHIGIVTVSLLLKTLLVFQTGSWWYHFAIL